MPGAHKIGAAISAPRITGGNFMDTTLFLIKSPSIRSRFKNKKSDQSSCDKLRQFMTDFLPSPFCRTPLKAFCILPNDSAHEDAHTGVCTRRCPRKCPPRLRLSVRNAPHRGPRKKGLPRDCSPGNLTMLTKMYDR